MCWRRAMSSMSPRRSDEGQWHLVQMPDVEGALVAMDPHTGRVLALVGGFSYGQQPVQPRRPGHAPARLVLQAHRLCRGARQWLYAVLGRARRAHRVQACRMAKIWKPKNYQDKFFGPSTLRRGIEQSRNVMTVRLARRSRHDARSPTSPSASASTTSCPMQLAMALGAGETTLLKMTTAYSMFANGGKKIEPTLIDRVQDRYGRTIFRHDKRDCAVCQRRPMPITAPSRNFIDVREQVMNPYTAYQITSMMEGVVQRGTGKKLQVVGKPVAGKTGTSNEERMPGSSAIRPISRSVSMSATTIPSPWARAAPAANWRPPSSPTSCSWRCATSPPRPSACRAPSSSFRSMPRPASAPLWRRGRHSRSLQARR